MNIRLDIEYDGGLYSGWQVQPRDRSVQGEIEKALATILQKKIRIIGAGRTDAGVHARGQVANFKVADLPVSLKILQRSLNGIVKEGITILRVSKADDDFHARYSAKWRTYIYSISKRKRSVDRGQYYSISYPVDIRLMKKAARRLKGPHDFKNLSVAKGRNPPCAISNRL